MRRVSFDSTSLAASKRRKLDDSEAELKQDNSSRPLNDDELSARSHPLGVRPLGNMFFDGVTVSECRELGLGFLRTLSDELILVILGLLDAPALGRCMAVSRALYAFCSDDDMWRLHTLQLVPFIAQDASADTRTDSLRYDSTWRQTFLNLRAEAQRAVAPRTRPIRVTDLYSDALYAPWLATTRSLPTSWFSRTKCDIVEASALSKEEFIEQYERPNRPVLIRGAASHWAALKWTRDSMIAAGGNHAFNCRGTSFRLADFFAYSDAQRDEFPLYLFDARFVEKAPSLGADYEVPAYFQDDLLPLLGANRRPNYRWLLHGAARSGSTFHKDPNATNAWNAVISGRKRWILSPPHLTPPGVMCTEDESDVTVPLSLVEWYQSFYRHMDEMPHHLRPLEVTMEPGDVMFVPNGWWHAAYNLTDNTVAITQNYVSERNLQRALMFMRDKPEQVSGCRDGERLYADLCAAIREHRKDLVHLIDSLPAKGEKLNVNSTRNGRPSLFAASSCTADNQKADKETSTFRFSFNIE